MAKKVSGMIKIQLQAGAATPAPPVGPALGPSLLSIRIVRSLSSRRRRRQRHCC